MLRPYLRHEENHSNWTVIPLVDQRSGQQPSSKKRHTYVKIVTALSLITFISSDLVFVNCVEFFKTARKLCSTYFLGDLSGDKPYWEADFPAVTSYDGAPRTLPGGPTNIGFVVTLSRCPSDAFYQPGVDTQYDPGHTLYDAAAVLKHSITTNLAVSGKYNCTMHAIVHPDAITCLNPNGDSYDRVKVLESLGYYVNIQSSPIVNPLEINSTYVQTNIQSDAGSRDLTSLYAATLDTHPAVVMTDFDTIMLQPIDPVIDTFLADPNADIAFAVSPPAPLLTMKPTAAPVTLAPVPPTAAPVTGAPTPRPTTAAPVTNAPVPPTAAPVTGAPTPTSPFTTMSPASSPASSPIAAIPPGTSVDTGLMLLKPSPTLVTQITNAFMTTPYDPVTGWDGSGVGGFPGSLGVSGILTHYFKNIAPGKAMLLDHCTYGNDHSDDCLNTPNSNVKVGKISSCGQPWTCPNHDGKSSSEKAKCEAMEKSWFENRKDFEDNCWIGGPIAARTGTFRSGVSLGFCNGTGVENYNRLVVDKPAPFSCDKTTQENSVTSVLAYGNGRFQNQKLTLKTGEHTGQSQICASGTIMKAGFEPPYNICIVIDISGSTSASFGGTPPGDVNKDGQSNTILDAEIGAALAVLQYIATSPDLGNTNVNIGLVTFSSTATYHGIYPPADPNDPMKINPALKTKLTGLRGNGYTNFDDALDKAINFFQAAPADRSQLMFFLSDGIPNVPGDGDNEPVSSNRINNHISALSYNSELAILNNLGVSRLAVGVGSESDIRPGYGLALIDNTPDEITGQLAQQVTTTDELTNVLMTNPVAGTVVAFQIKVNNVVDSSFGLSDIVAGPVGFVYGELIVSGLNPFFGAVNRVRATITIDFDGNAATTADQHTLSVENVIPGMMQ